VIEDLDEVASVARDGDLGVGRSRRIAVPE
jgi:hypothetical protein